MPSLSPRLIGGIAGVIGVVIFVLLAFGWRSERNALRDYRDAVVTAARDASGQPRLAVAAVPRQILLLGQARVALENALADQNRRVERLAAADKARQAEAAKALQTAEEAQRERSGAIDRLTRSASAGGPSTVQCAPSKTLQELWK